MTPIIQGLNRIGAGPALEIGRRIYSGTEVLASARQLMASVCDRATGPSDAAGMVFARLAQHLLGQWYVPSGDDDQMAALVVGSGRTAVLLPLEGFGGVTALAVWSRGGTVLIGPDNAHPAKVLAFLERAEAEEVVLSSALARQLAVSPAAELSDLSGITRMLCDTADGGSLTADELAALAELGPEPLQLNRGEADLPVADLIERVSTAADAEIDDLDVERAVAAVDQVGQAALLSMLNALWRAGCFTSPEDRHTTREVLEAAKVADEHRPLVRRWLAVLVAEGLLIKEGSHFRSTKDVSEYADLEPVWRRTAVAWRAVLGEARTVDYARTTAGHLPELLRGSLQAVQLLFPRGETELARAIYRESVTARYQQRAVAELVSGLARRSPGRPLRILEVGAGTGATTDVLLPALGEQAVDYLFTDVSNYFLDQARPRYGDRLRYDLFDIDLGLREQGYAPRSMDVVVAGGVLNAAANTDASVRRLADLLVPGGWLVLTEPTAEEYWVMISQAFMMTDAHDGRAETGGTFLTLSQWHDVLDAAGLRRELGLPGAGHPLDRLGHRVFAARTPSGKD